jgi:hypothetical protein
MTATIQEVTSSIMFGDFTNDQLSSVIEAIKYRRAQLSKETKRSLSIGNQVQFHSTKLGGTLVGKVEKIAIKYVTVRTVNGLWKVPAAMLTAV